MVILITGGAGYIGSVCVAELIEQGHKVVVLDDLTQGHEKAVSGKAIFYKGDFGDEMLLDDIFKKHSPEVVMHFAAETLVEFSMTDPARYFQNNVIRGITLLETMLRFRCKKIVFSSTAATFGEPQYVPIDEKHPQGPINAYGESKLMFEKILDWYHRSYGINFNAFRYFNAAGAFQDLGEDHSPETHLIPSIILAALGKAKGGLRIFGSDYPTEDGTCIRDYLHVLDIAKAHIQALGNLINRGNAKYNLGSGSGFTNLEVLRVVEKIFGRNIEYHIDKRRPGDPARLVASSSLAMSELGWKPAHSDIESIIASAWGWHCAHPDGYK